MTNSYRRLKTRRWNHIERTSVLRSYIFLVILIVSTMMLIWEGMTYITQSQLLRCYHREGNQLIELQDDEVPVGTSFFFHETSCDMEGDGNDVHLTARQACAVESAALHHPNNTIFLLVVAPVFSQLNDTKNHAVRGLLEYSNIRIRHIHFETYLRSTPLESLKSSLQRSKWPVSHASDVLRYTTLYKFRGTYLDLDVIMLKTLNITNFVGAESSRSLGAGVINFGVDSVGEEMAQDCAMELQRTYDGRNWGNNGPGVITRVLNRRCETPNVLGMISADCHGFHVLPVNAFYAFPFWKSSMFFRPGKLKHAQKVLNSSLVIHFWGKISTQIALPKYDADIPFLHYARLHCPIVYKFVNGTF